MTTPDVAHITNTPDVIMAYELDGAFQRARYDNDVHAINLAGAVIIF